MAVAGLIPIIRLAIVISLALSWAVRTSAADNDPAQIWCDPATKLCWQNPQRLGFDQTDIGLIAAEAQPYCESLLLAGHDDWRTPSIDELRTLIAGNAPTQPGGGCGVTAGARTGVAFNPDCHGSDRFAGPAKDGCYWNAELTGSCGKTDVAAVKGKMLETWARDQAINDPDHWTAYASFDTGGVGFNHNCSYADVRCVRDDDGQVPECAASNSCVDGNDYVSDPELTAICDADVCATSDAVEVTLHVPETLAGKPHQLMVFWYKEQDWRTPPMRPPDGGTDYNQVLKPDIDKGMPVVIKVPACTYYREEQISGEFRLWAHLQMQKRSQPMPQPGDYVWSSPEPVTFPLNGNDHETTISQLDITLQRVE
jgi:hypothetical protein